MHKAWLAARPNLARELHARRASRDNKFPSGCRTHHAPVGRGEKGLKYQRAVRVARLTRGKKERHPLSICRAILEMVHTGAGGL
jgi:hypothetical protein